MPEMPEIVSPFEPGSAWDGCYRRYLSSLFYEHSQSSWSVKTYDGLLRTFFRRYTGQDPASINRAQISDWLYSPSQSVCSRGKPPASSTVVSRLASLSGFYRYALEEGMLSGVPPTAGLRSPRVKRRHYQAFSGEELARFFAAIPTEREIGLRDRALFLFYFWTARRRMEVARLTWGNLTWGELVEMDGTVRQGWLYSFVGKGHGGQESTAELPPLAKAALDRYLEFAGRLGSMRPDSPLFVPTQGDRSRALSLTSIVDRFKRYVAASGLDPAKFSLHSLRHTAAQQRYLVDRDPLHIQRLLEHTTLTVTTAYLDGLVVMADPTAQRLEAKFGEL